MVAAAATGSAAALLAQPDTPSTTAFPSVPPPPPDLGSPTSAGPGAALTEERGIASPSLSASLPRVASARVAAPSSKGRAAGAAGKPGSAQRIADVPDRPAVAALWPVFTYTLQAAPGTEEPPAFPAAVPGFSLVRSAGQVVTVRENRFFTAVGSLPVRTATYAVCREQRFYVRWMAVDPRAQVEATLVDEHVRTVQNTPVRGSAGWLSSYGCVQPALRIRPPAGSAPDRATVIVETRVWQRT